MSTSSFDIRKELTALPFWKDLSDGERRALTACAQIRTYGQGELIYSKDQECLGLIRILSGTVRTFMLSDEGREIHLYSIGKGDTDVLSAACVMDQITFESQMVADSDCELLIVPAVCLSGFKASNVYIRCFIYEKLGERFSQVMHGMQAILFSRVDRRVAQVLLNRVSRTGNTVSLTHEQLAREINSSREVVSRVLKGMERKEMIRMGRGSIQILDPAALAHIHDKNP